MVRKTLSSFVLAAGCAIFLAVPAAQAQDARHDGLLDLSPVQRQGKIQRECGPITNEHLRASCVDSRNIDEDRRALSRPPANGRWNGFFAWDEGCGGKHGRKIEADG